ncbi:MAG: alpha/beta hydrolase [Candidatus Hodarchaeales archaeon]|jgi:acetyl esterase/lipase
MTILDRSRIREDLLKIIDYRQNERYLCISDFLKLEENQGFDFKALWQKVFEANELFIRRKTKLEDLDGCLTVEEMLFLARFLRYSSEFIADTEQKKFPVPSDMKLESIDAGSVPAEWQIVPSAIKDRVMLYFHGGGMILGSINGHRLFTVALGEATRMRVLSVDYRLAPEHPSPAQLEDCVNAYKWLLSKGIKPENIVIAGDSAGGNLTLTTLLKLRNDGIQLPVGAVCISPVTDYANEDDSFFENAETDPILADVGFFWWVNEYLAGADPRDPLISPLHADLTGLPPLLIQVSTSEILYSDSKRLFDRAKAAGVDVKLETWDGMLHVFQSFGLQYLSEAREAIANIGDFVEGILN